MSQMRTLTISLPDSDATSELGARLASVASPGDCILLSGPIGAGKTHLARALIQAWLELAGRWEEVPSPTFTLVQTYDNGREELWHADLYRLSSPEEIEELGLREAFVDAITLIEWPDRLGESTPANAIRLEFKVCGEGRNVTITGPSQLIDVASEAA